ncbi:MAG: amidohydrolase/deacetylase family metallohydrolase, partial [Stellaceae bacterium]
MKYDLLLRNGEVVDPGAGLRGRMDVAVAAGKIAAVAAGLEPAEARRVVDVGGRFILPGLVDVHAHL